MKILSSHVLHLFNLNFFGTIGRQKRDAENPLAMNVHDASQREQLVKWMEDVPKPFGAFIQKEVHWVDENFAGVQQAPMSKVRDVSVLQAAGGPLNTLPIPLQNIN